MTIASWLVTFEQGRLDVVRAALAGHTGIECRSEAKGSLVVLSESPSETGLEGVHQVLTAIPGVKDASLVAAFEDAATS